MSAILQLTAIPRSRPGSQPNTARISLEWPDKSVKDHLHEFWCASENKEIRRRQASDSEHWILREWENRDDQYSL
jgi:hypothetical protein